MDKDLIHCVKGHSYSVGEILCGPSEVNTDPSKLFASLTPNNQLYYAVLYLSPSDYHHYHAPTAMTLKERQHIIGLLNPVMPSYLLSHKVNFNLCIH